MKTLLMLSALLTLPTISGAATQSFTIPTKCTPGYALIGNGSALTCQPIPSVSGIVYMVTSAASDISGYTQLVDAGAYTSAARSTTTVTNPTTATYVSSRATNVGYPGVTAIPAGVYHVHIHAYASNASRFKLRPEIYIRHANGTDSEWLENSEETSYLTTSEAEYDLYFVGTSTTILTTDRIVYKLKVTTVGGAGTVTVLCGGTGPASITGGSTEARLEMPLNASVSNFVPYNGAMSNIDLGAHSLIVGATGYFGASVSETIIDSGTVSAGTINVDWSRMSMSSSTLAGSITLTFSGTESGKVKTMVFQFTQGGSGSYTVTWPTIRWPGGTAPTLSTAVGKMDEITILWNGREYTGHTTGLAY